MLAIHGQAIDDAGVVGSSPIERAFMLDCSSPQHSQVYSSPMVIYCLTRSLQTSCTNPDTTAELNGP